MFFRFIISLFLSLIFIQTLVAQVESEPTASEIIWARMIISADIGTKENFNEFNWSAISWIAVQDELIYPDERKYYKGVDAWNPEIPLTVETQQESLDRLRLYNVDLLNVPKTIEINRLPTKQMAEHFIECNRKFDTHLHSRMEMEFDRKNIIQSVIDDNNEILRFWELVRVCHYTHVYNGAMYYKRCNLKYIKDMVGEENYNKSIFPNYAIPYWRLPEGYSFLDTTQK